MPVFGVVANYVRAIVHGARVVEGLGSLARVYRVLCVWMYVSTHDGSEVLVLEAIGRAHV